MLRSDLTAFACKKKYYRTQDCKKGAWGIFILTAHFNPTALIWGTPHNTERMLMIMWKMRTFQKKTLQIFNVGKNTAVKEFNRMIKMSCRFSLHCITTDTWKSIRIFPKWFHLHCSVGGQSGRVQDRRSQRSHKPKARRCSRRQKRLQRVSPTHSLPWTCSKRNLSFWNYDKY